eukprot:4550961-Pyramimonas_sp.AAC.1
MSGEEKYAHAPILAMPILGPGSVHRLSWPRQEGVCTDPGPRVGLARIGACAYFSFLQLSSTGIWSDCLQRRGVLEQRDERAGGLALEGVEP